MASRDVDYAGGQSKCSKFGKALYDSDKGEVFGRTAGSWAKISAFYIVYYSCLAGFFAAMLFGFFKTLDDTEPTQTGMYSLIKYNPGMGFRPLIVTTADTTLVHINTTNADTYHDKVANIIQYLRENGYIDEHNRPSNITKDASGRDVFNVGSMGDACTIDPNNVNNSFGYREGKPCILLKVNKIFRWEPQPFDNDSLTTTDHGKEAEKALGSGISATNIGVTCEGENDGDMDSLGKVEFYPPEGFAYSFYPYLNAKDYRAPLVWAKFNHVQKGVLMQIWCKIWAKNIYHHRNDKAGSVRFELMIEDK